MKTANKDIPKTESSDPVTEAKKLKYLKTSIDQLKNNEVESLPEEWIKKPSD